MSETILRALRLALSSLLAVALLARLAIGMSRDVLSVVDFFSLFGVLSNTLAVIALGMLAIRPRLSSSPTFGVFLGGVVVYMSVTALLYAALLLTPTGIDTGATEPWVEWSLHVIGPFAMVLDWLFHRPAVSTHPSAVGIWLIVPALYLGYTLVRGAIVDRYPYPFLDPAQVGGYGKLAMWLGVAIVIIFGLGYTYSWWANKSSSIHDPA